MAELVLRKGQSGFGRHGQTSNIVGPAELFEDRQTNPGYEDAVMRDGAMTAAVAHTNHDTHQTIENMVYHTGYGVRNGDADQATIRENTVLNEYLAKHNQIHAETIATRAIARLGASTAMLGMAVFAAVSLFEAGDGMMQSDPVNLMQWTLAFVIGAVGTGAADRVRIRSTESDSMHAATQRRARRQAEQHTHTPDAFWITEGQRRRRPIRRSKPQLVSDT